MKKTFIIKPENNFTDFVEFASQENIDGVELLIMKPTKADTFSDLAERKRILEANGVGVSAVSIWHYGLADPAGGLSAEMIKRGIDYAGEIGADCFYTGPGEPDCDNPTAALADCYDEWESLVKQQGMELAVYLGHEGSYIRSEAMLADAIDAVPNLGLKIDPQGLIRNLAVDYPNGPCNILYRFGANLTFFHVKGLSRHRDGELEPPPLMDKLPWGEMFGIMLEHEYDGWVSSEPHGDYWDEPANRRKAYIRHTFRMLEPFMAN
ncbi:MAG: hypothetical protein CMK35_05395 [Porticoccaceae bacterium]|nr:hypothetical protein [Porticoccaceae bacterium]